MFLSIEQKKAIFASYPELSEKTISNGRVNYIFKGTKQARKIIVRELSYTGNGYICGAYLPEFKHLTDNRGWINIKDFSESALRELIEKAIDSFK